MRRAGAVDAAAGLVMPGMGRTVLVVDDDPIQRKLVTYQLEVAGFTVEVASCAAEALEVARRVRPDAVLSDVLMDDTDGFALCRALRRDPSLGAVPIILVSAYFNETDDRELAREVGATALVERSPSMQPAIESLIRGLAEGHWSPPEVHLASELHFRRVAHQLARLRDDSARSEARYLALFENASDAVSIISRSGVIMDVNRTWEQIMQRPRADLIGLHVRDFIPSEHTEAVDVLYREASRAEQYRHGAVPISGAQGVAFLDFTTTAIEVEGVSHVLAIGRDVTALIESQRALAASEQRYRSLLENIPDVVWSATMQLELEFASANAAAMTGFTALELLGGAAGPFDARVHPDDVARFRAVIADLLASGRAIDLEYRWQHRDGRWLWVQCRAVRAHHLDGIEYIDGIFTDVTERRAVEERLVQSQKVEALGQLTAAIAHDFNNILSVVIGNADLLGGMLPDGDPHELASEILDAGVRGAALASRLLTFARRGSAEPQDLDFGAVLRGVEPLLARALGRSIALTVVTAPSAGVVRGVASELEQILMNLAVNARDAMPHGGELIMATADIDIASGARGPLPPGRYLALAVTDSGSGMDEATRERVFEPFFTTKAAGKGTGLGLSTSYGIVRRHGGHVEVASTPGLGTSFKIYLPLVEPDAAASAAATASGSSSVSIGLAT